MARVHHGSKNAKAIGRRFKQAREEAGLSQRQLAAETPMTAAYISRIEAGARIPTVDALRSFAAPLGVSAEWLETGKETRASVSPRAVLRALHDAQQALAQASDLIDRQIAALDSLPPTT